MAELNAKIPIKSVLKETVMHVEVTGVKGFSVRLHVARVLIWLAAKVAGVGIEIKQ
jgi:hypothetical protein